jgi:hypothetical protein
MSTLVRIIAGLTALITSLPAMASAALSVRETKENLAVFRKNVEDHFALPLIRNFAERRLHEIMNTLPPEAVQMLLTGSTKEGKKPINRVFKAKMSIKQDDFVPTVRPSFNNLSQICYKDQTAKKA